MRRSVTAVRGCCLMAVQQAFRSGAMTKPMHAARAGESGVLCALGSRYGLTGATSMLDGESGFGRAMSGEVDWQAAVAGLGEDWTIMQTTQMTRITLSVDDECQCVFPKQRSVKVTVATRDGRSLSHHAPTRKGDPDAPLGDAEVVDKYRELANPVLGQGMAETLLDSLWRVDVLDKVADLPLSRPSVLSVAGD